MRSQASKNCVTSAPNRIKLRKNSNFLKLFPANNPPEYVFIDIPGGIDQEYAGEAVPDCNYGPVFQTGENGGAEENYGDGRFESVLPLLGVRGRPTEVAAIRYRDAIHL